MKFIKIFSFVLLGHVLLASALLLQPGCQSIDQQWDDYRMQQEEVRIPAAVTESEGGERAAQVPRRLGSDFNEPAFTQGQDGRSTRPRSQPLRPARAETVAVDADTRYVAADPLPAMDFVSEFNEPFETSPESGYEPYTVQRGDTLWGLSKKFGIPFISLLEANGMDRTTQLRVGQEIRVPVGYSDIEVTDGRRTPQPVDGTTIYEVRRGDTLSEIAARSGTSVSQIRSLNNMSGDMIRVGQRLIVPGDIPLRDLAPAPERTPAQPAISVDTSVYTSTHTVRSGETPGGIAQRYNMTVNELMAANNISDPRRLRAGTELRVKPATSAGTTSSAAKLAPLPPPQTDTSGTGVRTLDRTRQGETRTDTTPRAPEIIPAVRSIEPDELNEEESDGFGFEIFEEFDTFEDVPVERREAGGS